MAFPAYIAFGNENGGAGNVTYDLPTEPGGDWAVGDLLLLVVESANETVSAPSGWTKLTGANAVDAEVGTGTAAATDATRLTVFYRVAQSGDTAPTVTDPGDHQCGHTLAIRATNGVSIGNVATSTLDSSSTTVTCPTLETTGDDRMIVCLASSPLDTASWPGSTTWTNANLTNFAEGNTIFIGTQTNAGNGGAITGITARRAAQTASIGTTTSTWSTAAARSARITIELYQTPKQGALDATIPAVTLSGESDLEIAGALDATIGPVTIVAEETPQPITGAADVAIDPVTLSGDADLEIQGTATPTIAAITLSAAEGPAFAVGNATVEQREHAIGPTSGTWTSDAINTTGATLIVAALMRGNWADAANPKSPTDSESNTWSAVGTDHAYSAFPNSRAGVFYTSAPTTDAAHTFSMTFGDNNAGGGDEVTVSVTAFEGVLTLVDESHVERTAAASVSGVEVTGSGPAIYLSVICGNGPVGQEHDFQPSAGWTRIEGATATGDPFPAGYIQVAWAYRIDATGALAGTPQNCTWSNPDVNEGGQIFQAVFQVADGFLGAAAITVGAITLSATGEQPPITGDAAITVGDVTSSAAGQLEIQGASAVTLDAVTVAAEGTLPIAGTTDATIEPVTSAAAGELSRNGVLEATVGDVSSDAQGALAIVGGAAPALGEITLAAAGESLIVGSADVTIETVTLLGAARLEIAGAVDAMFDNITSAGQGGSGDASSGSVDVTIDPIASDAAARLEILGSGDASLAVFALAATGSIGVLSPGSGTNKVLVESTNSNGVTVTPAVGKVLVT